MVKLLEPEIGTDGWIEKIDLLPYFFRLTMDSATEFLFGESFQSQRSLLPGHESANPDAKFAEAFDVGLMALATRARFMELYWLYDTKEFRKSCKIIHEFVDYFVRIALLKDPNKKNMEKNSSGKEKYTFLDALAAETQDPIELRSELLHILLAGRDTTASHLGWSTHLSIPSQLF
jgi:cytochrome P450